MSEPNKPAVAEGRSGSGAQASTPVPSASRRRLLAALCASPLLAATGCERAAEPARPVGAPIRVGAVYWPGRYWVDVANRKGWFREAGLDVECVDTNADFFGSYNLLVEGKLDQVGMPLFDLVLFNARGKNLTGAIAEDISFGAESLVARPGIASVAGLAGKKLGLPKGTYLEYIWSVVASRADLKPSAVNIFDVKVEKTPEALASGRVDAILAFEPHAGKALDAVKGKKLFDTSQLAGTVWSVSTTRAEFARERAADVQALARVWQRASVFLRAEPDAAYAIVAAVNKTSLAGVRALARLDRTLDLRANRAAFSYASGLDSLPSAARRMNDFQMRAGLSGQEIDTSRVLDSSFVAELERSIAMRNADAGGAGV